MPYSLLGPMNLFALPIELICHILAYLEMKDLLPCTLVSKYLRKIILNSSRLQYTIELAKHRVVSLVPTSSSPSFATRLKLIRDRERAWRSMKWKSRHTLNLPPTGSVYEFVGGLYGNGREDDSRITASISFIELPSSDDAILNDGSQDLKMWTHSMGDVTIIDFTMDPSQDLLVLVALAPPDSKFVYELHLRSISTNRPHPKAPMSILPCLPKPNTHPPPTEIIAAVRVQVAGDLVALLIKEVLDSAGAHLQIWNWEHAPQYSCSMQRISGIDDFTFLAHDTFLLVRPTGRFEVYNFKDPITSCTNPVMRGSYLFPPLADGYMYWYISMSSNPAPGYVPGNTPKEMDGETSTSSSRQIYYPRPDERIHACCLYVFNPSVEENHQVHSFVFFLNINTLINPPAEWLRSLKPPPRPTSIPASRRPGANNHRAPSSESSSSTTATVSITLTTPTSIEIPIIGSSSTLPTPAIGVPVTSAFSFAPSTPATGSSTYPPFPSFQPTTQTASDLMGTTNTTMLFAPPLPALRQTQQRPPASSTTHIPWEVWGPQSTRWFEECLSTDWQHAIYGLRTVESVHVKEKHSSPVPPAAASDDSSMGEPRVDQGEPTVEGLRAEIDAHIATITAETAGGASQNEDASQSQADSQHTTDANPREAQRVLRIRDFNPYSLSHAAELDMREAASSGKGKGKAVWRTPRLVTGKSITSGKGVFKKDIESWLPYTEIVSEETFEVTDVMMDDCRLLLLKVRFISFDDFFMHCSLHPRFRAFRFWVLSV
ncbi:hypothetical protein BDQ12DRAFT_651921 [Crucibulum laeve]|uniref:F-box domain-containing protein n=1 Tax=Crucibulum laeve TaxID=68775 RepID=A0A5C3LZN2_9AGAR|nr:hypothetical protein BDQ12DRAFT_651921 [Crucibulum laeve]